MEVSIPDVVVQKDNTTPSVHEDDPVIEKDSSLSSQLRIDSESTNRNKSPVTVQEWVDSLPLIVDYNCREEYDTTVLADLNSRAVVETDMFTLGAEAGHLRVHESPPPPPPPPVCSPVNVTITNCHEPSEVDSHCSSVDSLLEARKPDPEEILLSLGFGGTASSSYLETGRVPKRFLSPSQLKGVDIEEFIRQQQDLIYTFESGFYGYRGLAGPSHSNPSVIVAKILEKLREHEKETALVSSCHQDSKKRYPGDQNTAEMHQPRRFSKVAHNVLTKIRCTPGSSVLSPDNRRWLDNQGNKSPEVARRLILGQQSFTFGHDGDLIESFDGRHKSDRHVFDGYYDRFRPNRVGHHQVLTKRLLIRRMWVEEAEKGVYRSCVQVVQQNVANRLLIHGNVDSDNFEYDCRNIRANDVGPDEEELSPPPPPPPLSSQIRETKTDSNNRVSSSGTESLLDNVVLPAAVREARNDIAEKNSRSEKSTCSSSESNDNGSDGRSSFASSHIPPLSRARTTVRGNQFGRNDSDVDDDDTVENGGGGAGTTNEIILSLRDEIDESTRAIDRSDTAAENPTKRSRLRSSNRNYSSEKRDKDSDEESSPAKANTNTNTYTYTYTFRRDENEGSEIPNECSDSATESELATYSPRALLNKSVFKQYEEYALLKSKIKPSDKLADSITSEQFLSFTTEQRTTLQSRLIREALEMYLGLLKEDNINIELKNCLCNEVRKVFDLVDGSSDSSRLAVIVRQMTLLLQQQNRLSAEIKELSVADTKTPSTCSQMCDQLLKRVQDLESLVQRNARELARMKNQLPRVRNDETNAKI